jgi:isoleucyl-tRNA synthetase
VFAQLKAKDLLFATERYVHRYPHCWRCKTELLYRLVDEWFINMGPKGESYDEMVKGEDGKERQVKKKRFHGGFRAEIAKVVEQVRFLPKEINGQVRELDWLANMGDWMISKKRFWGLALPIWVDDKDPTQFEVIGSREELRERAVEGWQEFDGHTPHRPWVDKVKIRNPRTGNLMSRIPDVGNPWLDAGIVAFSTMKYNTDRKYWEKWYPADFITESFPGQFRNWFYALLAMSTMMSDGKPPFKTLLGHGNVRDQLGHEMHKSAGNSIEFVGAAESGYTIDFELKVGVPEVVKAGLLAPELKNASKLFKDGVVGVEAAEYPLLERVLKVSRSRTVVEKERLGPNGVEKYPALRAAFAPMAADVIRWVYCRQEPAANIRFGPITADEVRSKVFFKLWNTYAMVCNYAIGDGFDPAAPQVPVAERQDVDRWLLSNLQLLIKEAREAYENYNVAAFALACEEFIEADLSNWYVRRNKDRLHSRNVDLDDAGRRDKLAAYQTLYTTLTTLCKLMAPCVPFVTEVMWKNLRRPTDPESVHLCDFPQMDASLVDTGLSADMKALRRVISLGLSAREGPPRINVKQPLAELVVSPSTLRDNNGVLLGDADRRAVERFPDLIIDELNVKTVRLHDPKAGTLVPSAPGWCVSEDKGTLVAVNTTITPELKSEGLSRDVIRQVQNARKDAKLDLLDKIALHLATPSGELANAISTHKADIARSVQATHWSDTPLTGSFFTPPKPVKIDGQPLTIQLRKV